MCEKKDHERDSSMKLFVLFFKFLFTLFSCYKNLHFFLFKCTQVLQCNAKEKIFYFKTVCEISEFPTF